ncbi:RagB/SusD family nutrient uptake outer membrane protein [Chitinophaga polysaccharea]|uniref:RagB/SusD family nutrient uptake outer membrane protein n=1 Tax=Chitinophaga TaxID=79328 RepID=UPI0014558996|nr:MULTISPECIES: RagB/SusD family nutrient uptake outer membrane protein [Chitinophaga]NLR58548.1 RagB/SusD family nutrient uptake outer membrane protein [Chitinophaga polysaccharea]NLU91076.1 RagB/SusD family nutrient uptake outer membrane protein [Chitinophaga sp. Ak27]
MKKILAAIIITGVMSSCGKKFLETLPINTITEEDFYKTPTDAYQGLVAAYSVLNWDGFGNIALTSEIASDNCFGGGGASDNGWIQWDKSLRMTDQNSNAWKKYYTGIYRANKFLQKVDGVNFKGDDATKKRYIAEAHFLRAYFYFDLVRMFGHVPLITTPLEPGNYSVPQASADSVYHLIASDLKQAAADLPATSYSSIPAAENGRATKWAAEALLGRVFLYYTGYYNKPDVAGVVTQADAITAIDDVINNSGYSLVPKYQNLFRASAESKEAYAGQNNQEGIFTIQFTYLGLGDQNQQNGNRVQVMIGIRSQVLGPYYKGWGGATVNEKLYRAFAPGDSRQAASIISINAEGYTNTYVKGDQAQYTGFFCKKYTPLKDGNADDLGGSFQWDNYDNFMAIRFADVLLMGAELNLGSNVAKAQGYINRVRDRAFGDQTHRITLSSKAQIMEERRLELSLEGLRYWDLLRQGMSVAKNAIDNTATDPAFNISFRSETNGLFSIPETQINLSNGSLIQNTGW